MHNERQKVVRKIKMYNFYKPQKADAMNIRIEGNAHVANTTVLVSFHKHHNVLLAQKNSPYFS
jgi:hypothetical protein